MSNLSLAWVASTAKKHTSKYNRQLLRLAEVATVAAMLAVPMVVVVVVIAKSVQQWIF
jgi:hypothetical protein